MITIDFSNNKSQSLFEYIYSNIKLQIINGQLKANEKLPSKRAFANHLGVSVITVQNAYSLLISEGYIYSIEKKGFYVTDIYENTTKTLDNTNVVKTEYEIEKNINNDFLVDLMSNKVALDKFPFSTWAKIMRNILNRTNQKLLCSQNIYGVLELRRAICKYLYDFRNIKVDESQIVIGAGTESLYSIIVQFLGQTKLYAVENPGYHKVKSIFNLNGAECCYIDLDDYGVKVEQLQESKADILHISPAHHFPTGIVMPIKRRLELLSWLNSQSSHFIIEDDYDSEFRFNGKPLPPLLSLSPESNIIHINTFSKTLAPSFRISYMVLPKKLTEGFNKKLGFCACQVSALEQYVLSEFINNGDYEKHIIRMKNYYRNLRNVFIQTLQKSSFSDLIKIQEEDTGLHFLVTITTSQSPQQIQQRLLSNKIKLPLLLDYYYEPTNVIQQKFKNTFVVNYSGLKKEQIPIIITALKEILTE